MIDKSRRTAFLGEIKKKIASLPPAEALSLVGEMIADKENVDHVADLLYEKAFLLMNLRRTADAIEAMAFCSDHHGTIESSFFSGQWLTEENRFEDAILFLSRCIDDSFAMKSTWFLDSAYLLRSYARARTGELGMSSEDLSHVSDENPMFWVRANPVVSKAAVLAMIESGH